MQWGCPCGARVNCSLLFRVNTHPTMPNYKALQWLLHHNTPLPQQSSNSYPFLVSSRPVGPGIGGRVGINSLTKLLEQNLAVYPCSKAVAPPQVLCPKFSFNIWSCFLVNIDMTIVSSSSVREIGTAHLSQPGTVMGRVKYLFRSVKHQ